MKISRWTHFAAMLALALLYVPLLAVAVFSVNSSRYGLKWGGFTLGWYQALLENEVVLTAARNTLVLALISTVIATALGTALAYGMSRFPWPRRVGLGLDVLLHLPVVAPDLLFAAALLVAFQALRAVSGYFDPGLPAMVIGHVTFQVCFVALVVRARLVQLDPALMEAARDLYASEWFLLRRVTLPLLAPSILAGALLAFILSLDDFVISFFLSGPESTTLPLLIYASVRRGVTPEIHALSTLLVSISALLVVGWMSINPSRQEAS